jgi:hypothetical protein
MYTNFGIPQAGAQNEITWQIGYDWLLYNVSTALNTTQQFWDPSLSAKPAQFRTTSLQQLALQKAITISALRLDTNIRFTVADPAQQTTALQSFLLGSVVNITVLDKVNSPIQALSLLPYELANVSGTVTALAKIDPFFRFPAPIEVPSGGDIKVTFTPLPGYTTAATAVTNPIIPNSGLTGNEGFFIALTYFGAQTRPIS